jgi:hypothetical protein
MTPLPVALGGSELIAWRLDQAAYAPNWDSGEGAHRVGGRWNSKGVRAVYCSLDPSTAILEFAVHKGSRALDTVPPYSDSCRRLRHLRGASCRSRQHTESKLAAARHPKRRSTGVRRRSAATAPLCRNPERGVDTQLEPRLRGKLRHGCLCAEVSGGLRARYTAAPAVGMMRA